MKTSEKINWIEYNGYGVIKDYTDYYLIKNAHIYKHGKSVDELYYYLLYKIGNK